MWKFEKEFHEYPLLSNLLLLKQSSSSNTEYTGTHHLRDRNLQLCPWRGLNCQERITLEAITNVFMVDICHLEIAQVFCYVFYTLLNILLAKIHEKSTLVRAYYSYWGRWFIKSDPFWIQWNLGSQTVLIMNKSNHEKNFQAKSISLDKRLQASNIMERQAGSINEKASVAV